MSRLVQSWLRGHRMPSSLHCCILVPSSLSSSASPPPSSLSALFSAGSQSTSPASSSPLLFSPQTSGSPSSAGAGASGLTFASLISHHQVKGTLPCILPWLRPKLVVSSCYLNKRQSRLHEVLKHLGLDMPQWNQDTAAADLVRPPAITVAQPLLQAKRFKL